MFLNIKNFKKFLADTDGAVTVEYVVLTAAALGVALASSDVVFAGLRTLSGNVDSELSGTATSTEFQGLTYSDGFDNGATGWVGASSTDIYGIGNVLGPIGGSPGGGATVTQNFDLDPNVKQATVTFDLYGMDSLDNEEGVIYIGGKEVGKVVANHNFGGGTTFIPADGVPGVSISANVIASDVDLGGADKWTDSLTQVSITVDNTDDLLSFGFGSTANQNVDDESFSIDNFKVTGLADPAAGYTGLAATQ